MIGLSAAKLCGLAAIQPQPLPAPLSPAVSLSGQNLNVGLSPQADAEEIPGIGLPGSSALYQASFTDDPACISGPS